MAKKNIVINGKRVGALAADVDFSKANTNLNSDNVQDAIVEVNAKIGTSAYKPYFGKKIGLIGDSFTDSKAWVGEMSTALGATSVNKAVAGGHWFYSTSDTNYNLLTHAHELYSYYNANNTQPDYILVMYGVNDYFNDVVIGDINFQPLSAQSGNTETQIMSNVKSHYSVTNGTFTSGIQAAIAYLQLMFPNTIIMVGWTPSGQLYMRAALMAHGEWDEDATNPSTNHHYYAASKYINRLKELALIHGVRYIDTFNCGINPWLGDHWNAYASSDGHPQPAAANTRIAAYMARLLLKEA